jgi:hypothetical protein
MGTVGGTRSHADKVATFHFDDGTSYTLRTCQSDEYDPAATHPAIGGHQVGPVDHAKGSAEPTWSMEIAAIDAEAIEDRMGAGMMGKRIPRITIAKKATGTLARRVNTLVGCRLEAWPEASSRGEAVMCSISGVCVDILKNGKSMLNDPSGFAAA